ncbi:MAG: hypothetical protein Edafosvirus14_16 [Edafosvirus sp.]|uniref:Uncharacterized protein n=1 Tax=Edafosvirus sp. TaxID=2487765 RepID=A0A3G4ZYI7_9VIRU|nr:MAG: hypothetical protein Edafosvirus14_16 [Edafosvirus sp.]
MSVAINKKINKYENKIKYKKNNKDIYQKKLEYYKSFNIKGGNIKDLLQNTGIDASIKIIEDNANNINTQLDSIIKKINNYIDVDSKYHTNVTKLLNKMLADLTGTVNKLNQSEADKKSLQSKLDEKMQEGDITAKSKKEIEDLQKQIDR